MPAVIEVRHLHKKYGDKVAVDDVSFTVERGEIFGILGPNGAGKTTTVECVEGLREPDGGEITVLGLDPRRDRAELTQRLGVQLQDGRLPDRMTVGEALRLYRSFYREPADPQTLMDALGLAGKHRTRYADLSGGQQQRLSIALALIGSPRVAVLDELTTGLDPQARRDTWSLIQDVRSRGVTILLVTHFMEEAERLCDRVAVIDRGRVAVVDTPEGLTERVQDGQRIRFRPSVPFEDQLLTALPEVTGLTRHDGLVVITGTSNALNAITSALARNNIVAEYLRVEQPSLEDAFVALTGTRPATETHATETHAAETHATETHAADAHATETHAADAHATEAHAAAADAARR
ncbi:ABC transporter ATP-binding protein [Kitasatospora sp. NBC_01287]|uniref:ABC transporter ATP-binding protein n=1 Tax=Kitasatospora sp. NBC_01287 TaxID=2903573 RepID=UPI002B1D366B|nr:ABC transporter ATP-binding protein [Kitasatospora sp. NBC_01287]